MKKITLFMVLIMLVLSACAPAVATRPAQVPMSGNTPEATLETASNSPANSDPTATQPAAEPAAPAAGGVVTRAISSEPSTLDPQGPAGAGQNAVLPFLFDTLIYRDIDNSYKPYLAESWETSPDGKMITFTLREGITFHDGTPLNAEAVRATYERGIATGSKSPLVSSFANVESIQADGDRKVIFTLKSPSPAFLSALTTTYAGIISPSAVEKNGDQFGLQPVGSGPFRLESWQPGESITLVRNEAYAWAPPVVKNQGAPLLEKIIFKVIPDPSAQLTAFEAGEVDVLFITQPSHIKKLSKNSLAALVETTLKGLVYLGFNMKAKPFDDQRVRLAIAHAIDKQELLQLALGGVGEVAFSPLASTLPGFDPALQSKEPAFDLEQNQALLTEAGYTQQSDGTWQSAEGQPLMLEVLTTTRPPNEAIATVIQEQLKKAGIPVTIRTLESTAAGEAATRGEYQAMLWRYDWNDADVLNTYLSSTRIGKTNRTFYENKELDQVLNQAAAEMDEARRNELYRQAQEILIADQPWIPLYTPKEVLVLRGTMQDVVVGPMGRLLLNDAWLKP